MAFRRKYFFGLGGSVAAVCKPDDLRWNALNRSEVEKIRISRYNGEASGTRRFPNHLIRSEPGETRVEDVDRIWEKLA